MYKDLYIKSSIQPFVLRLHFFYEQGPVKFDTLLRIGCRRYSVRLSCSNISRRTMKSPHISCFLWRAAEHTTSRGYVIRDIITFAAGHDASFFKREWWLFTLTRPRKSIPPTFSVSTICT